MYEVDSRDTVREVTAPLPSAGAPIPALIADEERLVLLYAAEEPSAPGGAPILVTSTSLVTIAVVSFVRPYAHMFGPPNDEAFSGHPLASRGLAPYRVWEVAHSSWARALDRMNSVHPQHRKGSIAARRHFIFAFHDTTFECLADSFSASLRRGSMQSALQGALAAFQVAAT